MQKIRVILLTPDGFLLYQAIILHLKLKYTHRLSSLVTQHSFTDLRIPIVLPWVSPLHSSLRSSSPFCGVASWRQSIWMRQNENLYDPYGLRNRMNLTDYKFAHTDDKKITSSVVALQHTPWRQPRTADKLSQQCTSTKPTTTTNKEFGQNEEWCIITTNQRRRRQG